MTTPNGVGVTSSDSRPWNPRDGPEHFPMHAPGFTTPRYETAPPPPPPQGKEKQELPSSGLAFSAGATHATEVGCRDWVGTGVVLEWTAEAGARTHRPCSSSPRGSAPTGSVSCPRWLEQPGQCTDAERNRRAAVPEPQPRRRPAAPPPPSPRPHGRPRPPWPCCHQIASGTDSQRREVQGRTPADPASEQVAAWLKRLPLRGGAWEESEAGPEVCVWAWLDAGGGQGLGREQRSGRGLS